MATAADATRMSVRFNRSIVSVPFRSDGNDPAKVALGCPLLYEVYRMKVHLVLRKTGSRGADGNGGIGRQVASRPMRRRALLDDYWRPKVPPRLARAAMNSDNADAAIVEKSQRRT
jgi:hypothetical protein